MKLEFYNPEEILPEIGRTVLIYGQLGTCGERNSEVLTVDKYIFSGMNVFCWAYLPSCPQELIPWEIHWFNDLSDDEKRNKGFNPKEVTKLSALREYFLNNDERV